MLSKWAPRLARAATILDELAKLLASVEAPSTASPVTAQRSFTRDQGFAIVNRDGIGCRHAARGDCSGRLEIDHVVPFSLGGSTTLDNGQMLCQHHNASKGNRFIG